MPIHLKYLDEPDKFIESYDTRIENLKNKAT